MNDDFNKALPSSVSAVSGISSWQPISFRLRSSILSPNMEEISSSLWALLVANTSFIISNTLYKILTFTFSLLFRQIIIRENPYLSFGEVFRRVDRKSTRLNSSHANISYAVFCLKKQHLVFLFAYFCLLTSRHCAV